MQRKKAAAYIPKGDVRLILPAALAWPSVDSISDLKKLRVIFEWMKKWKYVTKTCSPNIFKNHVGFSNEHVKKWKKISKHTPLRCSPISRFPPPLRKCSKHVSKKRAPPDWTPSPFRGRPWKYMLLSRTAMHTYYWSYQLN